MSLETDIGAFDFVARVTVSDNNAAPDLKLSVFPAPLDLPPGMSVARARAVLFRLRADEPVEKCAFHCIYRGVAEGSPCTGEGLDAEEWELNGKLVVIGTEDSDFLLSRMPTLGIARYSETAKLLPDRIELELETVPNNTSLHFVLVENSWPEPVEVSAWTAADLSHQKLLDAAAS